MTETVKFIQETNDKFFDLAIKYGYKKKFNKFIEPEGRKNEQWKYHLLANVGIDEDFPLSNILKKESENFTQREKDLIAAYINKIPGCVEVMSCEDSHLKIYNLINEKEYDVVSIKKLFSSDEEAVSQFIKSVIILFEGKYYLNEPLEVVSQRFRALNYVYDVLSEAPDFLFLDNDIKKQQTDVAITKINDDFRKIFDTDLIYISVNDEDNFLEKFFDYVESGDKNLVETLNNFTVDLSSRDYSEDIEDEVIGVFPTKTGGIYYAFRYDVLSKIYFSPDYKDIYDYKECILDYFLEEMSFFPVAAILKLYDSYKDKEKFKKITSEILSEIMTSRMTLIDPNLGLENWDLMKIFKIFKNYDPDSRDISNKTLPYISKSVKEFVEIQSKMHENMSRLFDFEKLF